MNQSLSTFFEQLYRPLKLEGYGAQYVSQYRTAIRWMNDILGRPPRLSDLNKQTLHRLMDALQAAGIGEHRRNQLRTRIAAIWRYADRAGLAEPYQRNGRQRPAPAALPDPDEGTVRHFFATVYVPQRLLGRSSRAVAEGQACLAKLRTHCGRDVRLDELSDALAADHLQWLLSSGLSPQTVNNHRARLFAIWRHACRLGIVDRQPQVPKLPVTSEEPDAWTAREAARIVAATGVLADRRTQGMREDLIFQAILLVGWWTALRRGTLLGLEREDVDLAGGWVTAHGSQMKNGRGKRYRLGQDAVDAVRNIWLPERQRLFPAYDNRGFHSRITRIIEASGVAPSSHGLPLLHKWRRTAATHVACNGGIEAASTLLGHSGSQVTLRYIDPTKMPGHDVTKILPALNLPWRP